MIRVYAVAIDEYFEQGYIEMVEHLQQCKKDKILRSRYKRDQLLSLFGDVLLRYGLSDLFAYTGPITLC